jgi:hypothetical protein
LKFRFHTDPDGQPHIHAHRVDESEVLEVFNRPLERVAGRDESIVLIGRTRSGRILKIIYAIAHDGDGIFVITAYDLPEKQYRALNRRLRRRRHS